MNTQYPSSGYTPIDNALRNGQLTTYDDGAREVYAKLTLSSSQFYQLEKAVTLETMSLGKGTSGAACYGWNSSGVRFTLKLSHKTHRGSVMFTQYPDESAPDVTTAAHSEPTTSASLETVATLITTRTFSRPIMAPTHAIDELAAYRSDPDLEPVRCQGCREVFYRFDASDVCPSCQKAAALPDPFTTLSAWDKYADPTQRPLEHSEYKGSPVLVWPHVKVGKGRTRFPLTIGLSKARALVQYHADVLHYARTEGQDFAFPSNPDNAQHEDRPHHDGFFQLPLCKGYTFGFGLMKAVLFASYVDQIRAFVAQHDAPPSEPEPSPPEPVAPPAPPAPRVPLLSARAESVVEAERQQCRRTYATWRAKGQHTMGGTVLVLPMTTCKAIPIIPVSQPAPSGEMFPSRLSFAESNRYTARPQIAIPASGNVLALAMQGDKPEPVSLPLPGLGEAAPTQDGAPIPSTAEQDARTHDGDESERRKALSLCQGCSAFTAVDAGEDGAYTCEACERAADVTPMQGAMD